MMESAIRFEIMMHPDAVQFLRDLPEAARHKAQRVFERAQQAEDIKYFKELREGIWEFRVQHLGDHYRFFAFWRQEGSPPGVYITHGWYKKQKRTPEEEIARAMEVRAGEK